MMAVSLPINDATDGGAGGVRKENCFYESASHIHYCTYDT